MRCRAVQEAAKERSALLVASEGVEQFDFLEVCQHFNRGRAGVRVQAHLVLQVLRVTGKVQVMQG